MNKVAFFDVDTLIDFMTKNGNLYIKDSEKIIPNIIKLIKCANNKKVKILGCADRHFGTSQYKLVETELDMNGGPFPMHCEDDTHGASKIPEAQVSEGIVYIESQQIYDEPTLHTLFSIGKQIIFEKQSYNVFWDEKNPGGNQNIDFSLNEHFFKIDTFFVYGVATEYCVLAAVLGLLKRKKKVWVIDDAIYHITEEGRQSALLEMMKAGACFIKTDSVINILNSEYKGENYW